MHYHLIILSSFLKKFRNLNLHITVIIRTGRSFLLFRTPESAPQAWKRGIRFSLLTLADKQYFPNKLEVPEPQKAAIRLLHAAGVTVAAQETPLSEMRLLETFEK